MIKYGNEVRHYGRKTISNKILTIPYKVKEEDRGEISFQAFFVKNNSAFFLKSGNFAQTTSDVYFEIEDLDLNNEYYLYVVAENANGYSQIYYKQQITEVINITTCEEFYDMTVNVNTYKNDFKLLNDLDFTSYNWVCDPSNTLKFQGNLDGQGYTISNLNIQSPYRKAAVFFEITNSEIKNINFDNCNIEGLQIS